MLLTDVRTFSLIGSDGGEELRPATELSPSKRPAKKKRELSTDPPNLTFTPPVPQAPTATRHQQPSLSPAAAEWDRKRLESLKGINDDLLGHFVYELYDSDVVKDIGEYKHRTWKIKHFLGPRLREALWYSLHLTKTRLKPALLSILDRLQDADDVMIQDYAKVGVREKRFVPMASNKLRSGRLPSFGVRRVRSIVDTAIVCYCRSEYGMSIEDIHSSDRSDTTKRELLEEFEIWADANGFTEEEKQAWFRFGFNHEHPACKDQEFISIVEGVFTVKAHGNSNVSENKISTGFKLHSNTNVRVRFDMAKVNDAVAGFEVWKKIFVLANEARRRKMNLVEKAGAGAVPFSLGHVVMLENREGGGGGDDSKGKAGGNVNPKSREVIEDDDDDTVDDSDIKRVGEGAARDAPSGITDGSNGNGLVGAMGESGNG